MKDLCDAFNDGIDEREALPNDISFGFCILENQYLIHDTIESILDLNRKND